MLVGIGFLSLMDGTVKWMVGAEVSVIQIVAVRGWIIVALLTLWVPRMGGSVARGPTWGESRAASGRCSSFSRP